MPDPSTPNNNLGYVPHLMRNTEMRTLWSAVIALGITQIIGWGTLNYSIAVLAGPMALDLKISQPLMLGAFTGALVVSGLLSSAAGKWLDRWGSKVVMSAGSLLATIAFVGIAYAQSLLWMLLFWAIAGAAMAFCLYDMAFAALRQLTSTHFRQAVTALTLFGGLASTLFWPLSHYLAEAIGWRTTVLCFAGLHFLVCLPLHLGFLKLNGSEKIGKKPNLDVEPPGNKSIIDPPISTKGLYWLTLSFALISVIFSTLAVHMIATLEAFGLTIEDAILIAAMVGPMQVAGRLVEFSFGQSLSATRIAMLTLVTMFVSLILLLCVVKVPAVAWGFALAYGAANGVMTIVRGNLPGELYGHQAYGALLGFIAGPSFIGKAIAPFGFAVLATTIGYGLSVRVLAILCLTALIAFWMAIQSRQGLQIT